MQESSSPPPEQNPMQNWFESLPETPPEPQKPRKKWLLIVLGLLILGAGTITLYLLLRPAECLTKEDYKTLLEQEYGDDEFNPRYNFYTSIVVFKPDEAAYDDTFDPTNSQIVSKIAQFYSTHRDKSIQLSISSTYLNSTDQDLATQRVAYISSQLVNAGVPSDNIQIVEPVSISPEEDTPEKITTATIAITSADNCRE